MTGLEEELNEALRRLGLMDWTVVWDPDPSEKERGLILPESRIILIHDKAQKAALETLAHECLEIKMRSMIAPWRETVNALLRALEKVSYFEKEKVIDSLVPLALLMLKENVDKKGEEGRASLS